MIRLYPQQARSLVVLLLALKAMPANERRAVDGLLLSNLRGLSGDDTTTEAYAVASSLSWEPAIEDFNYDETIADIVGQIDAPSDAKGDVSLIGTIVTLLGLPFGTSRLSAETLSALRRAILRPAEIEAFRKVSKEAFNCATCKRPLTNDELGTIRRGPDHDVSIQCLMCRQPTQVKCTACGETAPASQALRGILGSTKANGCTCRETKKAKVAQDIETPTNGPVDVVTMANGSTVTFTRDETLPRGFRPDGPPRRSITRRPTRGASGISAALLGVDRDTQAPIPPWAVVGSDRLGVTGRMFREAQEAIQRAGVAPVDDGDLRDLLGVDDGE